MNLFGVFRFESGPWFGARVRRSLSNFLLVIAVANVATMVFASIEGPPLWVRVAVWAGWIFSVLVMLAASLLLAYEADALS